MFKNVRHLGHVLDLDLEDYDEYVKFQDILDVIDLDNKTNVYDTQDKFEMKVIALMNALFNFWLLIGGIWNIRFRLNVKIFWSDVNGDVSIRIAWKYSSIEKRVMDIAVLSIMCANLTFCRKTSEWFL